MNFLYRGISYKKHLQNNGDIKPKGSTSRHPVFFGSPIANFGSGVTLGKSLNNAVIGHQTNSDRYPTSGVSTTPHLERAEFYATGGGKQKGIIYKINRDILKENGTKEVIVKQIAKSPTIPEDEEVILIHKDNGMLPSKIIIDVIEVNI